MRKIRWNSLFFVFIFAISTCFSKPKIYDCFLFFNELELLEIRLNEMYDYVDHFVLVECYESFQGNPKSLYYSENKHLFSKYADKIIHVIVNDLIPGKSPWPREEFQRNQITRGLKHCSNEDIIIISDMDEIIRGEDVERLIANLYAYRLEAVSANLRFYRWYLNRQSKESPFWNGPVVTTAKVLKRNSPEQMRKKRGEMLIVHDAGWHFSNMGGLAKYTAKLASFSHPEVNIPEARDPVRIYKGIQETLELVPIDETFPRLVQEQQTNYIRWGFIDYEGNLGYF